MEESVSNHTENVKQLYDEAVIEMSEDEYAVEGLENSALVGMVFTALVFALLVYQIIRTLFTRWHQGHQIHPDHTDGVNEFRGNEEQRNVERTEAEQRRIAEVRQQTVHECPICLNQASFPVMTDCGHVFCCSCIIGYWQHSKPIVIPVDCAVCRTTIHIMLPLQWPVKNRDAPENDGMNDTIHENNMRIDDYNRRFSRDRSVFDYIYDVPVLIPFLIRNFLNNDIFTLVHQVRIGLVVISLLLYIFLPTDIIPESIYGAVGFLDDCFFVIVLFMVMARILREYMARRGNAGHNEGLIFNADE